MILVYYYPVTSWTTRLNKPARAVSFVGHPFAFHPHRRHQNMAAMEARWHGAWHGLIAA